MIARGVTWTTGRTYYRDEELFSVTFPGAGRGAVPAWINVSQAEVEAWLRDLAAADPLVDVRYGHRVGGLRQDADGVEADAGRRHRARHPPGGRGRRAQHRPGAARHRLPRAHLRRPVPHLRHPRRPAVPERAAVLLRPRVEPGRQVLVHQCPDGTWRIDWQVPADHDLDAERRSGALDARIRKITGDVPYEVVWATVYRFHERCAAAFASGRVFLSGDAAHLYAPFGARGLNSGVQDADNLAWKLAYVRHGWAPPELLASYGIERRAAALENLRVTTRTMEFLVPQTPEQRAHRLESLEKARTHPDPARSSTPASSPNRSGTWTRR